MTLLSLIIVLKSILLDVSIATPICSCVLDKTAVCLPELGGWSSCRNHCSSELGTVGLLLVLVICTFLLNFGSGLCSPEWLGSALRLSDCESQP